MPDAKYANYANYVIKNINEMYKFNCFLWTGFMFYAFSSWTESYSYSYQIHSM